MTAPTPEPKGTVRPPNLIASVAADASDPKNPMVVLRLENSGIAVDFKIPAEAAGAFGMNLGKGLIQQAQAALAAAEPRLITPNGGGQLLIPQPGMPPNGAGR